MRQVGIWARYAVLAFVLVGFMAGAGSAGAAPKAVLGSFGTPNGTQGGQLVFARGVAINQSGVGAPAGTIYVAEANSNHRISQFLATGTGGSVSFVRTWGYDVVSAGAPNASNEVQAVRINAAEGQFALTFGANTTTDIAFDAPAAEVQTALNALASISTGGGSVAVSGGPGGVGGSNAYLVTFSGGPLAGTDVAQLSAASGTVPLGGGSPTGATVATINPGAVGFERCDVTAGNTASQCKQGVAGVAAGQFNNATGIAVDQSNGYVYVTSITNRRVDVFTPTGVFAGAFGFGVDTGAAALEVCTTVSICQAPAAATAAAGNLSNLNGAIPAIDPATPGRVLVPDNGNLRVSDYSTTVTGGVLTAAFTQAFGWKVNATTPEEALQTCTAISGCLAGSSGNGAGQFATGGSPTAAAFDSTGAVYVTSGPLNGTCSTATPCRVQKFASDLSSATDFAPAQLLFTSGAASAVAALNIAVDPANDHVIVLRKESASTYRVLEFDSSGALLEAHPTGAALLGTSPTNGTGLAVGTNERAYVNYGAAGGGRVFVLGPQPPAKAGMLGVMDIGANSATLMGSVTPPDEVEGQTFATSWRFEYSTDQGHWTPVPVPDKAAGSVPGVPVPIEEVVEGLQPKTTYFARACATTSQTVCSAALQFTTLAAGPEVTPVYPEAIGQTEATLAASVNPNGLATTYHFEWASQKEWEAAPGAYGHRIPANDRQIGSGQESVQVREILTSLSAGTTYHYRIVATNFCHPTNPGDSTPSTVPCMAEGPPRELETLNSCGLTAARCFELVSPADKGPVGAAGTIAILGADMLFNAAGEGSALAYTMESGLPNATAGAEVLYTGRRSSADWQSAQISPPAEVQSELRGGSSNAGRVRALSDDLSCGVVVSASPLDPNAPAYTVEQGGANLFRWDEVDGYTVITNLPAVNAAAAAPEPLEGSEYGVVGMSQDCLRVVFRSQYRYPGIDGAGTNRLYEWSQGTIKNAGIVAGTAGDTVVPSTPGALSTGTPGEGGTTNFTNAVSSDGSRVVFTAPSQEVGPESGKDAIFLRVEGSSGINVSRSETGTVNDGASRYQTASVDGGRIFFTARYGLAVNGASTGSVTCSASPNAGTGTGCDLYEYDLTKAAGSRLTDLSVDSNPADAKGASVGGVVAASDDGSHVYFAARGQLVPGLGRSQAGNESSNSYSLYLAAGGDISYVGMIGQAAVSGSINGFHREAVIATQTPWTFRTTTAGGHLLFTSTENVTGYDSGGAKMVYLYADDSGATTCLSCPTDQQPSSGTTEFQPLVPGAGGENARLPSTMISSNGMKAFFFSEDALAAGGIAGAKNLYQWQHDQVSLIASEPSGLTEPGSAQRNKRGLLFAGASSDASDVYFATPQRLSPWDTDERSDIYDARVGGGFAPPQPPSPSCNPLLEGSCQSPGGSQESALAPSSSTFVGPRNQADAGQKNKKKKKHKKKGKKGKKKGSGKTKKREANVERRAGK